ANTFKWPMRHVQWQQISVSWSFFWNLLSGLTAMQEFGWRVRAEWARERGQLRGSSHARARWNARRSEAVDGPRVFSSPRKPQPWPCSLTTDSEEVWVLVTRKDLRSFAELASDTLMICHRRPK